LCARFIPVGDCDVRTFASENFGCHPANARPSARHEGNLTVEESH